MYGISLQGMSQRKALQTFKKLKQGLVTLKLKSRFNELNGTADSEELNVTLDKTPDAGLGLELIVLIDAIGGYHDDGPHLLTFGRGPSSPLDLWCKHLNEGETNTHGEYLTTLKQKKTELARIASGNIETNLQKARDRYNANKTESNIARGDKVMLRRNKTEDSLAPRFAGPFEVLQRNGPNVKLRLTRRDKWMHLDHVKEYLGSSPSLVPITPSVNEPATPDAGTHETGQHGTHSGSSEWEDSTQEDGEVATNDSSTAGPDRRYPERERRPPLHPSRITYHGKKVR